MFEDSVLSYAGDGRRRRAIAVGSIGVQTALLTLCLLVPMLHPAVLPELVAKSKSVSLAMVKVKVEPPKPVNVQASTAAALRAPSSGQPATSLSTRGAVIQRSGPAAPDEVPMLAVGTGMQNSGAFPYELDRYGKGGGSVVAVKPAIGPVRLSSGVSNGMLLAPIRPSYPAIAKAAGVQGTVVVSATIDRDGRIFGAQVTSGPLMLRDAAIEAIREARYRPYLLNGMATAVETTISVHFSMER